MSDWLELSGRCALVTGGALGIGRAICAGLNAAGVHVVVADLNAEAGEQAASDVGAAVAIEIQRHADLRLQGIALHGGFAFGHAVVSPYRRPSGAGKSVIIPLFAGENAPQPRENRQVPPCPCNRRSCATPTAATAKIC